MKKVVVPAMLAASIAGNVFFARNALDRTETAQRPPAVQESVPPCLLEVARALGVKAPPGRRADDLATDVRLLLMGALQAPEKALDEQSVARVRKMLTKDEQQILMSALDLARRARGRRVLILGDNTENE